MVMNNTMNSSQFESKKENSVIFHVVTSIYILTGGISAVGNSLVVIIMKTKHRKPTIFKSLIAHLAVCDLLFAFFQLCDLPTWILLRWVYNNALCKIIPSCQLLTSLAAEGTIIVIAVERFKGITQPLKSSWKDKNLLISLSIVWNLALFSIIPYIVVMTVQTQNGVPQCFESWNHRQSMIYSLYLFVFGFVIPMALLAFLYGRIIFVLKKPAIPEKPLLLKIFKKRRNKDVRVTRLLVLVIAAFVVCVFPNHIGYILLQTLKGLSDNEVLILTYITLIPYPFHCSINPIIYSIVDLKFRRDVKNLFRCLSDRRVRLNGLQRLNTTGRATNFNTMSKSSFVPYADNQV